MKTIKIIFTIAISLASLGLFAQELPAKPDKKNFKSLSVGIRGVHLYDLPSYRFDGPLSRDMKGLNGGNTNFDLGVDLYLEKMFTPLLGLQLGYRAANISGANDVEYYRGSFSETSLDVIMIWSNLDLLKVGSPWNIYSKMGLGVGNFKAEQFLIQDDAPDDNFNDGFWEGHIGLGISYEWNNYLRFELESSYNQVYNDGFDGFDGATGSDSYLTTSIGVAYTFGSVSQKPMYSINYFGEGYLQSTAMVSSQEVAEVSTLDTSRIIALEERATSLDRKLQEAEMKIEELEKAKTDEKPPVTVETDKDPVTLYFDSNSSLLTKDTKRQLLADLEGKIENNQKLEVIGYADMYGKEDYNSGLKQKRANAVKEFLKVLGYKSENINIQAGESRDLLPQNQFLNRRVVVKILN